MKARMRKGFTLIELLVVVVIIGILAAIGVKGFASAQDRARNSSMLSNVRTVFLGIENWKTDNNGLPAELIKGTPLAEDPGGPDRAKYVALDNTNDATWPKYLPGGRLPRTPWSSQPQVVMEAESTNGGFNGQIEYKNTITMTGGPSEQAEFRLGDKGILTDGMDKKGTTPGPTGPSVRTDYGYMYYLGNSSSGRYAILGVGKYNGTAYVVAVKTNFN